MISDQVKKIIKRTILEIEKDYQEVQGLILTEDDLKCIVYHRLAKYSLFSKPSKTSDKTILSPSLHSELSWYDSNGRLTIKPDITILEQRYLSILHGVGDKVKLPSKNYSFSGDALLLELKFIRNKTGIRSATVRGPLRKDLEKINRLQARLESQHAEYSIYCYFIVFNKTNIVSQDFEELQREINNTENSKSKLLYASGKVEFPE